LAATRYKSNDFKPYLFQTTDYGQTWTAIHDGIDRKHFTRVLRADPVRPGLLYAGTERGMYLSLDDGRHWQSFQLNLPIVPITDLTIKDNDLIVATQGRSFYVLDDLTPLQQWQEAIVREDAFLWTPRPTYRLRGGGSGQASRTTGANPRPGINFRFYLQQLPSEPVTLEILDPQGRVARRYSNAQPRTADTLPLALQAGLNTVYWDLQYPAAETFPGMILWGGGTGGPRAVPGTYTARLSRVAPADASPATGEVEPAAPTATPPTDSVVTETQFEVRLDPRASSTLEDVQAQFDLLIEIRDKLTETHRAIKTIRQLRPQLESWREKLTKQEGSADLIARLQTLGQRLTQIEEALYQTKLQSAQDPLNYPIRLNNRLSGLVGVVASGDFRPTRQAYQVRDEVVALIDQQLTELQSLLQEELPALNVAIQAAQVPPLTIDSPLP